MDNDDKAQTQGVETKAIKKRAVTGCERLLGECLTNSLRPESFAILKALKIIDNSPPDARIYRETSGKGCEYCTLKYRRLDRETGRSRQASFYLGQIDDDILKLMRGVLAEKRAQLPARVELLDFDDDKLRKLKYLFQKAMDAAREISRKTEFRFHGYWLRRRT